MPSNNDRDVRPERDEDDGRPNILLLFPDQHRFDWLPGEPGLPVRMPNLEGLTDRGTRFTQAFTPSPICAPARACLASGRDYDSCGVPGNQVDYPLDQPTYYQSLRATGYEVTGVGKFDLHKPTHDWGLDGARLLDEWGFTDGIDNEGKIDAIVSGADHPRGPYMAFLHREGLADLHVADFRRRTGPVNSYTATHPTPLPDHAYCDNWIADNAVHILRDLPRGKPWHLAVNFTGPHNPMDVTEQMQNRWDDVRFPGPVEHDQVDDRTHQQIRRNYAAMLENIDAQIGRLLDEIARRGELDRTLVIYSSDHGEMLGDHNRWAKSTYYRPSIGVPLIIAGPGVMENATTDALVSLQDLTATFLHSAGVGPLPEMEGRSLWRVLTGETTEHRAHVTSGLHDWNAVVDGRFKLVRGVSDGTGEVLFDLRNDPHESTDIAEQQPEEVQRLGKLLGASPWN